MMFSSFRALVDPDRSSFEDPGYSCLHPRWSFGEHLLHLLLELFCGVDIAQFARFIEEPHRWDLLDAKLFAEFVLPSGRLEILRPGKFLIGDKAQEILFFVIHADAHNLEAATMQFFVGSL